MRAAWNSIDYKSLLRPDI